MTDFIPYGSIGSIDREITSRSGNHVKFNKPQDSHFTGDGNRRIERNFAGGDIGEKLRARQKAIGHDGESEVHRLGFTGGDIAGGDRRDADEAASVIEIGGGIGVLKSDLVRIGDGEIDVERDVEIYTESGEVETDVEVANGDGIESIGRTLGLEGGEGENEDDQNDHDDQSHRDGEADGDFPARFRLHSPIWKQRRERERSEAKKQLWN